MPSPGDSISITALSVSISRSGSPFATLSPSFLNQEISFPVSWAISRAGMTTLMGIGGGLGLVSDYNSFRARAGFDHLLDVLARLGLTLSRRGQRTVHRVVVRARHQKLLRREACDYFVARRRNDNFFLDARRAPAIL